MTRTAHLREMAGWPNVEIMILPLAAGAHASPNGAFDVFRLRRPYPPAGCISTVVGAVVVRRREGRFAAPAF